MVKLTDSKVIFYPYIYPKSINGMLMFYLSLYFFPKNRLCGFVNDVLHFSKRIKHRFRRLPVERSHWEIIILPLPYSELFFKVGKGIKLVGSIEFFVIFAVAALHLAIVSWGKRANQLV